MGKHAGEEREGGSLQYLANIADDAVPEFCFPLCRVLWPGAGHKHKRYGSILAESHNKHTTVVHRITDIIAASERQGQHPRFIQHKFQLLFPSAVGPVPTDQLCSILILG